MRAPLHLLMLSVVGIAPAGAQGKRAGRTTDHASGSIELDIHFQIGSAWH